MSSKKKVCPIFIYAIILSLLMAACKKNNVAINCENINISFTLIGSNPCTSQGKIIIASPIGASWQYKVNNSVYQTSPSIEFLLPGTFIITAKNANGCTDTATAVVNETAPGPLFTIVKNLLANNCTPCHTGTNPQAGLNWTKSCDIINHWDRIKARAVDGNPTPMPQAGLMPLIERTKIMDWINAGHLHSN